MKEDEEEADEVEHLDEEIALDWWDDAGFDIDAEVSAATVISASSL